MEHTDVPSLPKFSWQAVGESDAVSWKHVGILESAVFWEPLGAPLHPKNCVRNFIHPKLPLFQNDDLCRTLTKRSFLGYEEDVSSMRDDFSQASHCR